jgi:UDP-N-acetylglucosamine--N-acetylmuramyl-(pentapeptide) pyrophosphoryl-undecaprenol N-acetylglucosamine transferase
MRIVFTGGGTGGHVYPLIAVAEALNDLAMQENLAEVKLYYFSNKQYDPEAFKEQGIEFRQVPAGKLRIYFDIKNFFDVFVTGWGILVALYKLFVVYPDVVFAKGGYASFPTIVAAAILRIPIIVHESDSAPGRVTRIASKVALRVAVSYREAMQYFPKRKVVHTGQPVRRSIAKPAAEGAFEFLRLDENIPTLVVFGGSLGAVKLNDAMITVLPELVQKYQVIHQVGRDNLADVQKMTQLVLQESPYKERYQIFDFLNPLAMRMVAGAASLIVSRAGSMLFEFAAWGVPVVVIPRTQSVNNHNMKNAYAMAHTGAAVVIEEANLKPHVLMEEIDRILGDQQLYASMKAATSDFYIAGAATAIARDLIVVAQSHES